MGYQFGWPLFLLSNPKPNNMAALGEYVVENLEYVTSCVEENYTEYETQQMLHGAVAGSISFAACMVGLFYLTLSLRNVVKTIRGVIKDFRK